MFDPLYPSCLALVSGTAHLLSLNLGTTPEVLTLTPTIYTAHTRPTAASCWLYPSTQFDAPLDLMDLLQEQSQLTGAARKAKQDAIRAVLPLAEDVVVSVGPFTAIEVAGVPKPGDHKLTLSAPNGLSGPRYLHFRCAGDLYADAAQHETVLYKALRPRPPLPPAPTPPRLSGEVIAGKNADECHYMLDVCTCGPERRFMFMVCKDYSYMKYTLMVWETDDSAGQGALRKLDVMAYSGVRPYPTCGTKHIFLDRYPHEGQVLEVDAAGKLRESELTPVVPERAIQVEVFERSDALQLFFQKGSVMHRMLWSSAGYAGEVTTEITKGCQSLSAVAMDENYVYAVCSLVLHVLDLQTFAPVAHLSISPDEGQTHGFTGDAVLAGKVLLVGRATPYVSQGRIVAIDVSDPANPFEYSNAILPEYFAHHHVNHHVLISPTGTFAVAVLQTVVCILSVSRTAVEVVSCHDLPHQGSDIKSLAILNGPGGREQVIALSGGEFRVLEVKSYDASAVPLPHFESREVPALRCMAAGEAGLCKCPSGTALTSLHKLAGCDGKLSCLAKLQCARPAAGSVTDGCYEVALRWDTDGATDGSCRPGDVMVGLRRYSCDRLDCLRRIRCCALRMGAGKPSGTAPTVAADVRTCTAAGAEGLCGAVPADSYMTGLRRGSCTDLSCLHTFETTMLRGEANAASIPQPRHVVFDLMGDCYYSYDESDTLIVNRAACMGGSGRCRCPDGYVLSGLHPTPGCTGGASCVETFHCVRPKETVFGACEDVPTNWHTDGWVRCPKDMFVRGFVKAGCDGVECLTHVECCQIEMPSLPAGLTLHTVEDTMDRSLVRCDADRCARALPNELYRSRGECASLSCLDGMRNGLLIVTC